MTAGKLSAPGISARAWQRMLSGRRLDLLDPSPLDIEIADIAHGLARGGGWDRQNRGAHIFSGGQHTLFGPAGISEHTPRLGVVVPVLAARHRVPRDSIAG